MNAAGTTSSDEKWLAVPILDDFFPSRLLGIARHGARLYECLPSNLNKRTLLDSISHMCAQFLAYIDHKDALRLFQGPKGANTPSARRSAFGRHITIRIHNAASYKSAESEWLPFGSYRGRARTRRWRGVPEARGFRRRSRAKGPSRRFYPRERTQDCAAPARGPGVAAGARGGRAPVGLGRERVRARPDRQRRVQGLGRPLVPIRLLLSGSPGLHRCAVSAWRIGPSRWGAAAAQPGPVPPSRRDRRRRG